MTILRGRGAYRNLGVLVGHSAVRTAVMGEDASVRKQPTDAELAEMKRLVGEAMDQGAIGLGGSYSLNHSGWSGVPMPSTISEIAEFDALVGAIGGPGRGVVEIDHPHNIWYIQNGCKPISNSIIGRLDNLRTDPKGSRSPPRLPPARGRVGDDRNCPAVSRGPQPCKGSSTRPVEPHPCTWPGRNVAASHLTAHGIIARTTHTISRTRPSSRSFERSPCVPPLYLTWSFERLQSNPIGIAKSSVAAAGTGFSRRQQTIATEPRATSIYPVMEEDRTAAVISTARWTA